MPSYNKLDRINALVNLELNEGNISKTSRELGVNRLTLASWQRQLESDLKLLKQVQAAKENLANFEELSALKAQGEISKRLDEAPDDISTKDLLQIKDSGIKNSRLIRGEATAINCTLAPVQAALRFIKECKNKGATTEEALEMLRQLDAEEIDDAAKIEVIGVLSD